jgi:predicted nucleotidyltransferase
MWTMLSVPPERRLDPAMVGILRQVEAVARACAAEYFVVGATARDIQLAGVFGLSAGRATRDVDLGVAMKGWQEFERTKVRLVETGVFRSDERIAQRLYYLGDAGRGYPLDLIPFGGVELQGGAIAWPPDGAVVMHVTGYGEAFASAVLVEVEPGFVLRVASLAGLAILKLIAWSDRGTGDSRDAIDLATLLRHYGAAGNEDRLYGTDLEVLNAANYNFDLAGARLLGVDAGRIAWPSTHDVIAALFNDTERLDRLVLHVAQGVYATRDHLAEAVRLPAQFQAGFEESR